MAEAITIARMPESWRKAFSVTSAGTAACDGMKAASTAVNVLEEMGIDLSGHRTKFLTRKMVDEADLVIAMTGEHERDILRLAPDSRSKVIVFGELDSRRENPDIGDPLGRDEEAYRRTGEEIERLVYRLIDYLAELFKVTK
jgi:protein-tyrosine-phosphatase